MIIQHQLTNRDTNVQIHVHAQGMECSFQIFLKAAILLSDLSLQQSTKQFASTERHVTIELNTQYLSKTRCYWSNYVSMAERVSPVPDS